jgi:hypothetical protein
MWAEGCPRVLEKNGVVSVKVSYRELKKLYKSVKTQDHCNFHDSHFSSVSFTFFKYQEINLNIVVCCPSPLAPNNDVVSCTWRLMKAAHVFLHTLHETAERMEFH